MSRKVYKCAMNHATSLQGQSHLPSNKQTNNQKNLFRHHSRPCTSRVWYIRKKDHSIIVLSDCKHLLWSNCCQNKDIITYLHKYCKLVNQKNVLGVVSWPNYDKIHILVHVIQPRHQFDHFIMCMKFAEKYLLQAPPVQRAF